jgi:hypothetical protein
MSTREIAPGTTPGDPLLFTEEFRALHAYRRAANYLSAGQIYLLDNPLLREPLTRVTSSRACSVIGARHRGLTFIYVHLNRVIRMQDLDAIYICGPGHGGPGIVANTYLWCSRPKHTECNRTCDEYRITCLPSEQGSTLTVAPPIWPCVERPPPVRVALRDRRAIRTRYLPRRQGSTPHPRQLSPWQAEERVDIFPAP